MPSAWIVGQFGGAREIVERPPVEGLFYTDDTQMMVALAEELCEAMRAVSVAGDE